MQDVLQVHIVNSKNDLFYQFCRPRLIKITFVWKDVVIEFPSLDNLCYDVVVEIVLKKFENADYMGVVSLCQHEKLILH